MKKSLLSLAWATAWMGKSMAEPAAQNPQVATNSEADVQKQGAEDLEALKKALNSPWRSIVVAFRLDCSRTGVNQWGFKVTLEADSCIAVAPWARRGLDERTGASSILSLAELQGLIEETTRRYEAAASAVHPMERMPPQPRGMEDKTAWWKEYVSLGGTCGQEDYFWMEVSVVTLAGESTYSNMLQHVHTGDVFQLVTRFGKAN